MKPRTKLAETQTPDGGRLVLYEHDGVISINLNGAELMHAQVSTSEVLLGELGVAHMVGRPDGRILIGGLGLGFTLQRVLEFAGSEAEIMVVELIPAVIEWNRIHLRELNGALLDDPRVSVRADDVIRVLSAAGAGAFNAILLDIDNGPVAMVAEANRWLYSSKGLKAVRRALAPGGRVVFWSAGPDKAFENRLRQLGFTVKGVPAKVHERAKRAAYLLYVADMGK